MKTLLKFITTLENRNGARACFVSTMLALALCLAGAAMPAAAQTAGEGSIEGTVTDTSGAVIPHATVSVTNNATGLKQTAESSSGGLFVVEPLLPGTYTVEIAAKGFKSLVQDNVVVDALQVRTLSPKLEVGTESTTVTVTAAPPVLDTADAALGLTVENTTYSNLPIAMTGSAQRDPTAFGTLTPGSQAGARLPIIGGTGSYLGQLYLDGMPATTVNQQGDNRVVSLSMSIEAVDQFQVLTSTPPAEYMGAGSENFTMRSGGLKYHGQVSDFVRNTVFDAWTFTSKAATVVTASGTPVQAPKPIEHQNELSASGGGVVPFTHKKLFVFMAYDKYHIRTGASYALYSIPSQLMLAGNFTELNGGVGSGGETGTGSNNPAFLYDPTSTTCPTSSVCTRTPFQYNGTYNVIPPGMLSPQAKAMAAFLPKPTNASTLYNNYLGGLPGGYDDRLYDWRADFDISPRQRLSTVGVNGARIYLTNFSNNMPLPYVSGTYAKIYPQAYIVEHVFTINPNLVNQIKYSFTRFIQPQINATDGVAAYKPSAFGITNTPAGQAGTEFPGATFGTTAAFGTAYTAWTSNGSSTTTQQVNPNTYALLDNVDWVKGKHSFNFGFSYLWEEINSAAPVGFSTELYLNYNAYSTANFASGSNALSTGTASAPSGFAFASYMLGAVGGSASNDTSAPSFGLYPLSETGGRYHPIAPYFQDSYKFSPKLTIELGLRWDYLPPFHEVKDRWTFLNPSLTNPLTGTLGMLQFAGNYGGTGVSCGCRTPVKTYWKNWGPRLGFAYQLDPKTVIRSGVAMVYTQAGGVGGRGGNATGTGQTGFNMSATGPTEVGSGATAGPSYWLNNSSGFPTALQNTGIFGPGYVYPSAPTPNVAAQELNTGYYVSGGKLVSASSVSYADPYVSGRAPVVELWNFGVERSITNDMTLGINYAGNESHFIINSGTTGSNARGYWTNQLNPQYLAVLGSVKDSTGTKPILNAAATTANAAIVSTYFPNAPEPAFFVAAGNISTSATVAQMLTAFPQYSGVSDTYGNVGNFSYHAVEFVLNERMHNGLTFNVNYTFSKNLGDDGTYRSGFNLPVGSISNSSASYKADRIDRSWTAVSIPSIIHAYGVYQLPFGKGKLGGDNPIVKWAAGGWQFSSIYTYDSGTPLAVTWSGSSGTTLPGQGTAMPDMNPGYLSNTIRQNGKWGSGPNGYNTCNLGINALGQTGCTKIQYLNPGGFSTPQNISTTSSAQYLIGNAPRTRPYGVRNPYSWDVDAGLRRSFPIHEGLEFVFEADAVNVWNHVIFGSPTASWSAGSTTFGTITGANGAGPGNSPRDWQFAGHINF